MIRIDYYFTSWIVIWFLLYYFNIIKINPKLILICAIYVNILLIFGMFYNNVSNLNIICALIVLIITKLLPYYIVKDQKIVNKDINYSLLVFIIYLVYVQLLSGNIIKTFNEIYYENLILGKKTPIPLFILAKIIEINKNKNVKRL
jgi:hypothetical protein